MPRIASITSQSLTGISIPVDITGAPPALGSWTDDNGTPVTVRTIISPVAMQINGVFAVNPALPFNIQGVTSGATTTITIISLNTGTILEIEDSGNSTSFQVGEQLDII